MLAALALLIFGSLVLAGYALAMMLGARQEAKEALERRLATTIGLSDAARRGGVLKDRRLSTIAVVNTFLSRPGIATSMIRMVARAGLKKRAGEVLLYVPLAAFMGFLLVTLTTGKAAFGIAAGAVGAAVPLLVVRR